MVVVALDTLVCAGAFVAAFVWSRRSAASSEGYFDGGAIDLTGDDDDDEIDLTGDDVSDNDKIGSTKRSPEKRTVLGVDVYRTDLGSLEEHEWLNDAVISVYVNVLKNQPSVISDVWVCMPSSYVVIKNRHSVKRLTQQASGSKILIFICNVDLENKGTDNHWCIVAVDVAKKRCFYFDSCYKQGTTRRTVEDNVLWFLEQCGQGFVTVTYRQLLKSLGVKKMVERGQKLSASYEGKKYTVSRIASWKELQKEHEQLVRYAKPTGFDRPVVVSQKWAADKNGGGKDGVPDHFEFAECQTIESVRYCGGVEVPQQEDDHNCGVFALSMVADIMENRIGGKFRNKASTIETYRNHIRAKVTQEWNKAAAV